MDSSTSPRIYAVLGSTGNCGLALINNLLARPEARIRAYCRNRAKLARLLPAAERNARVDVVEGSIQDADLLRKLLRGCDVVFLVVSTNDNVPGCRAAQDATAGVIRALRREDGVGDDDGDGDGGGDGAKMPRIVLLSSATIDEHLSRHAPWLLRQVLLRSASNVYEDLRVAERLLRAEADWLTSVFIKPGALSIDAQRGHALSLDEEESPISYLDLAAGMIEAADDGAARYDMQNVGVINTGGKAKFPSGTPLCIFMGLVSHFLPFLFPYLPRTGPA
ncbi:putative NAD-dependent epimerase/dehydratase [Xylariaceae sp. FL0804]|nr:putative NAD-dependent epimerase/dehydratase [Xylariaceae sp. FL0804]